ncbi:hypothetical protein EG329_001771 [Mollisiaceae sp. DMI_Dod_QoI]|nr:hypothetical protein EG329_001771 [Helotiales sp. DMI_Dod_QoI]
MSSKHNFMLELMSRRSKMRIWKSENYEKLRGPRDIRVLIIEPGPGIIIQCSIRTISLDDENANFEALSYMWDQADYEERGQQVKLMRHIYTKAEQVMIDLGGRTPDLRAMNLSNDVAKPPISWYTYHYHSCGRAHVAVEFVRRAWEQEDPEDWLRSTLGKKRFSEEWRSVIALFGQEYWTRIWIIQEIALARKLKVHYDNGSFEWQAIYLVHRVWQEFLRSITSMTDPNLVNWFVDVQSYSVSTTRRVQVKLMPDIGILKLVAIRAIQLQNVGPWDIQGKLRIERASNRNLQLLDLLASYFTSFSTNPRDKIYGLIGLADDNEIDRYEIDYSAKLRQVLQYLVQFMLESTEKLDVICYASFHKGLPSWVPYWGPVTFSTLDVFSLSSISSEIWSKLPLRVFGQRRPNSFAPLRHRDMDGFLKKMALDKKFAAAGSTKAEAQIVQAKGCKPILIATGCVVDEIAGFLSNDGQGFLPGVEEGAFPPDFADYHDLLGTSSDWLENKMDVELSDEIKQMLGRFLRMNTPFLVETKVMAFLKTLTYDRTQTGEVAGSIWWAPFQKLLRNGGGTSASSPVESIEDELQQSRDYVRSFLNRVHEVLEVPVGPVWQKKRRLYVTKTGLIGLGEPHSAKGDFVCVLKGCFRPILVKSKTGLRLEAANNVVRGVSHGCTYLHGYMSGRAIEEMSTGLLKPCIIELK